MRTTITLDEDVAIALEDDMKATGRSFKETVNTYLRRALTAAKNNHPRAAFRVEAQDLKRRPGFETDKIDELLDLLDGPHRR